GGAGAAADGGHGTPWHSGGHRYLVVNADEKEPGTMKDRWLLEGNPHQLIEGALIAAWAIQADIAYVFLRREYTQAGEALARAIEEARQAKYIGANVLGSPWSLTMRLHLSVGRYMCGEESGLLNALEGRRATPRAKPPFPQVSGLWGRPTVVNNVETLSNVPHILREGADWYKALSPGSDPGTKLYGVSGNLVQPGLWELPMGTTARQIIDLAGGMKDGLKLKGFLPGGASTDFLTADQLDTKMDFDSVARAGSRLGTGTMIVLDDHTCPVGMVLSLEKFFARESCGFCTPCREGLPWVARTLQALEDGKGEMKDLEILQQQTVMMAPGRTFCALAPGAVEPLQSALKLFRADFEAHVHEKRCPYK
ncbi:MAG TPA: NADH-ubiquinone oxidoreductase-F iron-sulfur binding region domain-containing protein, partial [Spirochaetia bacterium]|nr:NADH-ubiquinone oxidoreductase-F iron-sulfur binding region domain-containing protein [Spirochaetia bacterium]